MATQRKDRGMDLDDVPASGRPEKVKPADLVDMWGAPKKWARVRLFGSWYLFGGHWVQTKTREGKKASFYTPCLSFDGATGKRDASKNCAWCKHEDTEEVRFSVDYWSNGIVRSLQKERPERSSKPTASEVESGFKEKDSDSWTPVRAIRFPGGPIRDIKSMKELNVHENAEGESIAYPVSHVKFGCDIMVKKDPDAPPAKQYSLNKGEPKPLTKEEKGYLVYELSSLQGVTPEDPKEARKAQKAAEEEADKEYASWFKRMHPETAKKGKGSDSDDEDDEDEVPSRKKVVDDDDDDVPAKKPVKKKPVVEDDDEDDEPPPRKKKPVVDEDDEDDEPPPKRKKPPVDEEDEDDDPPPRKPAAKKGKAKPVEDEEDEDDDPPPRKKKPVVDEDDEDEDPPPRKPAAKKGKAKPPVDEDDEEDPPPRKTPKKVVDEDDDDL